MCCIKREKILKLNNELNNQVFNGINHEEFNNIDEKESYCHIFKVSIALILFYIMMYKIIKYVNLIYK